jgi:hypothetical protein
VIEQPTKEGGGRNGPVVPSAGGQGVIRQSIPGWSDDGASHRMTCDTSGPGVNRDSLYAYEAAEERPQRYGIIQSLLSFAATASAFGIAAPRAVLSKIHHTRALASKLANCATSIFRESLE